MIQSMLKIMYALNGIVSVIFIYLFVGYTLSNPTSHTGIPLRIIAAVFLIASVIDLIIYKKSQKSKWDKILFYISETLLLLAFSNIIIFEHLGIMMNYDIWADKIA